MRFKFKLAILTIENSPICHIKNLIKVSRYTVQIIVTQPISYNFPFCTVAVVQEGGINKKIAHLCVHVGLRMKADAANNVRPWH